MDKDLKHQEIADVFGGTDQENIERMDELERLFQEKGDGAARFQLSKRKPREQTVFIKDLAKELSYLHPNVPLDEMYPILKDMIELMIEHLVKEEDIHLNKLGIFRTVFMKNWKSNVPGKKGKDKRMHHHFAPTFRAFKEVKDRTYWGYDKKAHGDTELLDRIEELKEKSPISDIDYVSINMMWDEEASVWIATSNDIPGLVLESGSYDALIERVKIAVPELIELNQLPKATAYRYCSNRYQLVPAV